MCLKWAAFLGCLGYSVLAWSQNYDMSEACRKNLLAAEEVRNTKVYTQCGFDDKYQALPRWSSWVQNHNMYQAMYELCVRYSDTLNGQKLCQKAVAGGNGPALLRQGDSFYEQKNYIEALQSYTNALKSPLLTEAEKGHIAEKIGVLYLNPQSSYYNPTKGLPVIEKASEQRGALSNNILGAYALLGLEKQQTNMEKAFKHFWRAILLGCPNAEENLGLFHLVRQNTITLDVARQLMQDKIFTCQSNNTPTEVQVESVPNDCNCAEVLQREQLVLQNPYQLLSVEENHVILQGKDGRRIFADKETILDDGLHIQEIHKSAVILSNGKERYILNLAPNDTCVQICHQNQSVKKKVTKLPRIKPYRLSFSSSECADILYYAERLVDTNLPFVGKKECGYSGQLETATQLLLGQ